MPVRLSDTDWNSVQTTFAPPQGRYVAEVIDAAKWSKRTRGANKVVIYTLSIPSALQENIRGDEVDSGKRVTARIEYPDTDKGRAGGESAIKRVAQARGIEPMRLDPTTVTNEDDPYDGGLVEGLDGLRFELTIDHKDNRFTDASGEEQSRVDY